MVADVAAADDWDGFISDAARVLTVSEEIHTAAPAFIDAPFDTDAQERMREVLNSRRLNQASAAARRIAGLPRAAKGI